MNDLIITIDLEKFKEVRDKLTLEEYVILYSYFIGSHILIDLIEHAETKYSQNLNIIFKKLESEDWLKIIDHSIVLREKALSLFINSGEINFDEFWDNFPRRTPNGRPLRAFNKVVNGVPTRDYIVCKKKYLKSVRDKELHNQIVATVIAKNKVLSPDKKNFENNLETYINQKKWEQDIIYLDQGEDNDKFTERI